MMVRRTGDWGRARRIFPGGGRKLHHVLQTVVRAEANALRANIIVGLRKQAPGGTKFTPPLSKLTLAARRLAGFRGRKTLIRNADLRNSIAVISRGDKAFIGVPSAAKNKGGKALVRIAQLQEFGSSPIVIPITPKMRRFLALLFKKATRKRKRSNLRGNGTGVVVVQIPARPFLRPAFESWRKGVAERVKLQIRLGMGWN